MRLLLGEAFENFWTNSTQLAAQIIPVEKAIMFNDLERNSSLIKG